MPNYFISITFLLLLAAACSSAPIKDYPVMPEVSAKIDVNQLWVAPVGERSEHALQQLPLTATVNGKIFVANAKGDVGVLDAKTGVLEWVVELRATISSGPGVGSNVVALTTKDAELIALDQTSGKELWRSQLSAIAVAKPLIAKNKIYIQTIDEKLYALNIDDGKRVWVESRDVPSLTLRGTTTPVFIDSVSGVNGIEDYVITGFASGRLTAFSANTGKMLWETTIATPTGRTDLDRMVDIDGIFAVKDGLVYVTSFQGRVAAVSVKDGAIVWNREMSSYSGLSINDKQIYLSDEKSFVWALDSTTGATLWRQEKLKNRDISTPVVMKHGIVVADGGGYVHWLSKDDGDFIARKNIKQIHADAFVEWGDFNSSELDYGVSTMPEVSDSVLMVRSNNGDLVLFDVQDKSEIRKNSSWYSPFTNLFSIN